MSEPGEGQMRAAHQIALLGGLAQYALPGLDGLSRIDVVIDRDRRMAELRLRCMDDVAPEQEAFSPAFDHVAAHAGRVAVLGNAAHAGEQASRTVERP